ncbi:MAG: CPBP family intramembrane metalloprotease [Herpetosiphonaceae bacterium]|nr:CPBP family intramembrane metalloprotease [Herpetosiphonaceae bacterium]
MSLLAFEHVDHPPSRHLLQRPRWRYGLALLVPLLIAWPALLWAQTLPTQEFQAIVSEVGSYAVFVGVFCWIAWYRQPHGGRRALIMVAVWASISILVALLTKRHLTVHFLSAGVADSPQLYWGLLFIIPVWLTLGLGRHDQRFQANGFQMRSLGLQIISGVLAGGIISFHFITTIRFSGITNISLKPWPYMTWTLGYELFQSLAEELFFRGVLLRSLQQIYKLNFWQAMAITTVANMSIFLIKASWQSPINLAGLIMYLGMYSVACCLQFRYFQSILPGYITNIFFSMFAVIRG